MFLLRARRRRGQAGPEPAHAVFGTIGWLFADLMFALAMAFLVATTVGQPPRPAEARPDPSASRPSPSPSAEPVLELEPVKLEMTVDYAGLLAGEAAVRAAMAAEIRRDKRLAGRHAGLVLSFGGAEGGEAQAIEIADRANDIMIGLGREGFVFRGTVFHRPFLSLHTPPETLTVEVYLFEE